MTWAIHEPSGFGMFLLNGEPVGSDEAIQEYYATVMTDEEKTAAGMQNSINYSYFSQKHSLDKGPLHDLECDKEFRVSKSVKNLGAMIFNGPLMVEERMKAAIEDLEPGVHQFWPITISMPRGKVYPVQYYGLRIAQFRDSFRPEQSDPECWKGGKSGGYYFGRSASKKIAAGLAFSMEEVDGAHLWRERKIKNPGILMSDVLREKVLELGLKLPAHHQVREV